MGTSAFAVEWFWASTAALPKHGCIGRGPIARAGLATDAFCNHDHHQPIQALESVNTPNIIWGISQIISDAIPSTFMANHFMDTE
eukprot:6468174-Amphidinium_carterae.1